MARPAPDNRGQWDALELFDMYEGFWHRNLLGLGDPDVHRVGDQWVMYLGGFTTRFTNNLFSAVLPPGAPLSSVEWSLTTTPGDPQRAAPLVRQPPRGSWDHHGLHTPSYVSGIDPEHGPQERIYYSGRSSWKSTGPTSHYSIGFLRRSPQGGWVRRGEPVLTGTTDRPSVLEPIVRYEDGKWRMWYLSTPREAGPGDLPALILDASDSPLPWYSHGAFGPAVVYGDTPDDRNVMYVFFTGVRSEVNWFEVAARRVLSGRKPPLPSPFYFAVGRMACSFE